LNNSKEAYGMFLSSRLSAIFLLGHVSSARLQARRAVPESLFACLFKKNGRLIFLPGKFTIKSRRFASFRGNFG